MWFTRSRSLRVAPSGRILLSRMPRRDAFRYGIVIGLLVAALTVPITTFRLFEQVNLLLTNLLYTSAESSGQIALIAIDDLSLGKFGRSVSTWSRDRYAKLVNILAEGGARVVVFDVLFDTPTDQDTAFAEAIRAARNSQVGTRVVLAVSGRQGTEITLNPNESLAYRGSLRPVEPLIDAGAALGHVNVSADVDGYVRRIPLIMASDSISGSSPTERWVALSGAAYLSYLRISYPLWSQVLKVDPAAVRLTDKRAIPVDLGVRMLTNFIGPSGAFPTYSFASVHDGEVNPALFKDKIVLVGALNATGVTDRYLVPIERGGLMAGVEIHANALETILQNRPLVTQSPVQVLIAVLVAALGGSLLFMQFRGPIAVAAYLALATVFFLAASVLFTTRGVVVTLAYPGLGLTLALFGALLSNAQIEMRQRLRVQSLLDSLARLSEERLVVGDILPRLTDEVRRLIHADHVILWLWDEERDEVRRAYDTAPVPVPPTAPLNLIDVRSSTALNTRDYFAYEVVKEGYLKFSQGWTLIPLTHQNHPVGAIGIENPRGMAFESVRLDLLRIFAENTAPLLANARLYTAQLQQKDLIESILGGSPDPILVLDSKRRLIRANIAARAIAPAFETAFTQGKETTRPIPLSVLLKDTGLKAETIQQMDKCFAADAPFTLEIMLGEQTFNLLGAPLHIDEGAWVLVLNNISTLKELDALKTQMIRMASHDLKNPLGVVMGYTDLLLRGRAKEPERFLRMIDEAARRMNGIITDILNIERLRAGRLDLVPTDLTDVLQETFDENRSQAEEKKLYYSAHLPPHLVVISLDGREMKEALSNLISNAIKYTPEGGAVTVTLTEQESMLQISVKDTGYGIPKDAQAGLFKPFFRVRTRETASIPGTGLGLSLVKAVIDAHGGKLWVESEEGKGSTFYIDLVLPKNVSKGELYVNARQ